MSNQAVTPIVTYTPEEQKNLVELQNNARIFKNMILLLQNGLFPGSSYGSVAEALSVAQALYNQSQSALSSIQQSATERSSSTKDSKSNGAAKKSKKELKAVNTDEADDSVEN